MKLITQLYNNMDRQKRIKYLEGKLADIPKEVDIEAKYRKNFEKYAGYQGNGVYTWKGLVAADVRELFLLGVLVGENIKFKDE